MTVQHWVLVACSGAFIADSGCPSFTSEAAEAGSLSCMDRTTSGPLTWLTRRFFGGTSRENAEDVAQEAFAREAYIMSSCHHPNIAEIYGEMEICFEI